MDADTILAELQAIAPGAKLRLGDNHGFYWASLTEEQPNGQTHTKSTRIALDATLQDVQAAAKHLQDE